MFSAGHKRLFRLAGGDSVSDPTFSPDSRLVGTISHTSGKSVFVIRNVDGTDRRTFSMTKGYDLAFMPDGKRIAF